MCGDYDQKKYANAQRQVFAVRVGAVGGHYFGKAVVKTQSGSKCRLPGKGIFQSCLNAQWYAEKSYVILIDRTVCSIEIIFLAVYFNIIVFIRCSGSNGARIIRSA